MKRTEIKELGEFGLIERLSQKVTQYHPSTVKGIGDDAAVMDRGALLEVVSTDLLLEGVHFDLSFMPLHHLGYKAVAVNVSDIAAMNAQPQQITVGLGLSNRMSVEAVDALYAGIYKACEEYRVDLVGGDTTSSRSGLVLAITALGQVERQHICYRSGARKGDIICVTGDLGAAYLGLQVLLREKAEFQANPDMKPQLERYGYVVERQLKPEARMDIVYDLREKGVVPTSMIDVSDGLASELKHLAKHSGLGLDVYEDKLPIAQPALEVAAEFQLSSATCMLNGGEDYELAFTLNPNDYEKLKLHPDIHFIGVMREAENGARLITKGEQVVPLLAQGWDHFGD
ncbi:MAG: thiamine-phosphate kinase [Cytophagales bacterium]|nr:thiamine-phosphate kinase [Cytophagales bacterium]